ncbi:MAG: AAA family ATPase [Pirellulales bacterium]|nr:AAA family ATPase [Pirellulales bacterium]
MNIFQEITDWASALPGWQSDAVRRFLTQDEFTRDDEDAILAMLKASRALTELGTEPPVPKPVAKTSSTSGAAAPKVLIKEIHSLEHINALISKQSIRFAQDGITVIYGENGAGKSGYARVLKHACHARDKGGPIHPNIAKAGPRGPARATIEIAIDGADHTENWTHGAQAADCLAHLAVFDSGCARVFLDGANEVVYIPYGLDVFQRLASLCGTLKQQLQREISQLPPPPAVLATFLPSTVAGKLIAGLSDSTTEKQLQAITALSGKDSERLGQLEELTAAWKTNQPKARAAELRRTKLRLEQLRTALLAVESGLSDTKLAAVRSARTAFVDAQAAAKLASTAAFQNEPLTGVGGGPWRELFIAAKKYSEEIAYPGESFPVTGDDAACVLCQQPLMADGKDRLKRFQEFIEQQAAQNSAKRKAELDQLVTPLRAINASPLDADATLLEDLKAASEPIAAATVSYQATALNRKEAAIASCESGDWTTVPACPASPAGDLQKVTAALEARAAEFDAADKPQEQEKLQHELAELRDRKRFFDNEAVIREHLSRLKRQAALNNCIADVGTTQITRVGSELMERAITGQLEGALQQELASFGVQCVPLRLKKSGDHGKTKHQLTISTLAQGGVDPSGILSEGEQRVVAIASFLAELHISESRCGIIFDDPVSSLDHRYRDKVAQRLVKEGSGRQVIIFTHDIVMLLAIKRSCAEQQVPLFVQTVRKAAHGPGECDPQLTHPWHGMSVKERVGVIRQQVVKARPLHKTSDPGYADIAKDCYGKLRETWERVIEEVLLNDVVQRYRPSIETQRLSRVSIDGQDYVTIDQAMSKCSALMTGHDEAGAIASTSPTPDEIDADIKLLDDFRAAVIKRQDIARKATSALLEPPAAIVAPSKLAPPSAAKPANTASAGRAKTS